MFATHAKNLRASDKEAGFYHWLMFEQRDAKVEAAHFGRTVGFQAGETGWMDIEQLSSKVVDGKTVKYVPDHAPAFTLEFAQEFHRLEGFFPGAYINYFWLSEFHRLATPTMWSELMELPLWLSFPNGKPGDWATDQWSTYGWKPIVHQFTFKDAAGMDGNWFGAGPSTWRALGKPAS